MKKINRSRNKMKMFELIKSNEREKRHCGEKMNQEIQENKYTPLKSKEMKKMSNRSNLRRDQGLV